jgi:capsid protein
MTVVDRVKKVLVQAWDSSWLTNTDTGPGGYEAAKSSPNRSSIDLNVQNARKDISKYTRLELIRKSRYLHRNSPIVRGLIERLVTFTVGTGLHPTPNTSDETFNDIAGKAFREWAKQPDVESRNPFESLQQIIFRAMLVDGDIFNTNTFGSSGRPRIQLIESQDICHKNTMQGHPDGIELDAFGRPEFYVWREVEKLPADSVVHYYLPERAGQKRGVSVLAAIIITAHDIDDILALEKAAVKDGSSKLSIIKTETGELENDDGIGSSLKTITNDNDLTTVTEYYRNVLGPESVVMRKGDEHTPYVSGRPSPAWQGFMEWLANMICLGAGLPPSLLLGSKIGGADTRRELATAQRTIDSWQIVLASKLQQVYEYVIGEEIRAGYIKNVPKDWRSVEWQFPPKLTVDAGREADADREDVKLGLLTRKEYFGRWGLDWKEQTDQAAKEAKYISDKAKELGIERGEISLLDPNELSSNAGKEADKVAASKPYKKKGSR